MKRIVPILVALLAVMVVVGLVMFTQRDLFLKVGEKPEATAPEPEIV